MRIVAFVAAAVVIAACNVLSGVNDFSTPDCEDCERRECPTEFTACIANIKCADYTKCLARCSAATCTEPCRPPLPTSDDDAHTSRDLQGCAQTRCSVCASAIGPKASPASSVPVPPPNDAASE